jgi:hypothetical protein
VRVRGTMIDALLNVATFVVLVLFIVGFGVDRPNARHRPREGRQHPRDESQFSGITLANLSFPNPAVTSFSISEPLTAIVGDLYNIQMQVTAVPPPGDVDGAGATIDPTLSFANAADAIAFTLEFSPGVEDATTPATDLGALGLLGWRKKRKAQAVA